MADVDHPKTHVEDDEDVTLPRTQPESPKHEGIDPLTESDTMYPAEDTKGLSEKAAKRELNAEPVQAQETAVGAGTGTDQGDAVSESADNLRKVDEGRANEEPANADGKLPKDAQKANKVSSDRQNTSPSNKPATVDEPTDPDASNSVSATDKVKAADAKPAKAHTKASTRPTNNYPKDELK